DQVRFGMMLKSLSGVELGGHSAQLEKEKQPAPKNGSIYELEFRFIANLAPGVYFLNCGCSGVVGGQPTYLHRITGAVMLRILPDAQTGMTGMVDFAIVPKVGHA